MAIIRSLWRFITLRSIRYELINRILLSSVNASWSTPPRINGLLCIQGKGRIKFGKSVKINSGKGFNIIGGDTRCAFVIRKNATLIIGEGCGISNSTIVCHEAVSLGKNVKIGGSVRIYDTDFHHLDTNKRRNPKTDLGKTKPVLIGDDVFIGAHSIILKGSIIGEGAIIGAGSVVRGTIPKHEIWMGNPAQFVRKNQVN